jgi:hypothetical protein
MSIKERRLQAETRRLRAERDLAIRTSSAFALDIADRNAEIVRLKRTIEDLRELREFDRIKLERLRGMTV